MTITLAIVLLILGLVATLLTSALHLALKDLARTRVGELTADGPQGLASRIALVLADLDGHALAMALARVVTTVLTIASAVAFAKAAFALPETNAVPMSTLVATVAATGLSMLLFAVMIPASMADHAGDWLVVKLSQLVRGVYITAWPLVKLSAGVDEIVRRLAGGNGDDAEAREAELLSVVEEGQQEGQFDNNERRMIEAVVDFKTTTIEEIMTPRTDVVALQNTDDLDEVKSFVRTVGHSRIPVYDDNLDHVVGLLYAKDLLRWLVENDGTKPFVLKDVLREAVFVPETKTVRDLLTDLIEQQVHIAVVADEYGGTSGLVTFEDVVEEIFGDVRDEYEEEDEDDGSIDIDPAKQTADVDARVHIDDLNERLEPLGVTLPEGEDYDTVGGFVVVTLGRIPGPGEAFRHNGLAVTVVDAEPTRVTRVRLEVISTDETRETQSAGITAD
ncbi:MAG: hemolysin family protein [Planctomycetota bacterium]